MKPDVAHEFVKFIPDDLKERTLYISIKYSTAVHKCFCGCGREVVTPISPTAWRLIFDGKTVSLHPSIGSWNLPCQSHYFITRNKVVWAPAWTDRQIVRGREREARLRELYLNGEEHRMLESEHPTVSAREKSKNKKRS